jgi:hypothetical protein
MMRRLVLADLGLAGQPSLLLGGSRRARSADAGVHAPPRRLPRRRPAPGPEAHPLRRARPNITSGTENRVVLPDGFTGASRSVDLDPRRPQASGSGDRSTHRDGWQYTWHLTEQELNLMPVVMYRLTSLGRVTPFVGVGPRFYFLRSTVRSTRFAHVQGRRPGSPRKVGFGVPLGVRSARPRRPAGRAVASSSTEDSIIPPPASATRVAPASRRQLQFTASWKLRRMVAVQISAHANGRIPGVKSGSTTPISLGRTRPLA